MMKINQTQHLFDPDEVLSEREPEDAGTNHTAAPKNGKPNLKIYPYIYFGGLFSQKYLSTIIFTVC